MKEVEVSRTINAPREAVLDRLSPRSIVEFTGTYEVEAVERTADGWRVSAVAEDLDVVLEFTETESGYVFVQREGPFEAMYSSITVSGADPVEATVRSCFTFDMPLARLTDWFASWDRKTELERLLVALAGTVEER